MPRREVSAGLVENEARWLPPLASRLTLPVPTPSFLGEPGHGYPWPWVLVPWIPGESAAHTEIDHDQAATDLAGFLRSLHVPAPAEAPLNPFRGTPLQDRDAAVRLRIDQLADGIDADRVTELWDRALEVPVYTGPGHWLHGDLHPHNILVVDRLISGVIDFGDITSGDPATDLAVAWSLLPTGARHRFRDQYGGDDSLWDRARGWALAFALAYLANSADNPTMARLGEVGLRRLLKDD